MNDCGVLFDVTKCVGCGSCTVEIGHNTSRGGWEKDVQTVACRAAR